MAGLDPCPDNHQDVLDDLIAQAHGQLPQIAVVASLYFPVFLFLHVGFLNFVVVFFLAVCFGRCTEGRIGEVFLKPSDLLDEPVVIFNARIELLAGRGAGLIERLLDFFGFVIVFEYFGNIYHRDPELVLRGGHARKPQARAQTKQ